MTTRTEPTAVEAARFLERDLPEDPAYDDTHWAAVRVLVRDALSDPAPLMAPDVANALDLSFVPTFLRDVLRDGAPNPAAVVVLISMLGSARKAAGKGTPSHDWCGTAYLRLIEVVERLDTIAGCTTRKGR